ncbi:PTS galactitol transporter subunit IIA [Vagococcus martis]|uniref:PTS galactitol transporter subunit IIA n=2 Tax=Vagococcus martis TaxID=1768210 RepID=A0A1V4DKA4_9ENTE|nr:PTS galactitol transporter subunit IIA [Vagococcus martis]
MNKVFFDERIIVLNQEVSNREEGLEILSLLLQEKGLVTADFYENILKRESVYPTGLSINGYGVAIPHTDSEFVNKSQLGFLKLNKPVIFNEMGTLDNEVEVNMIFMLALKEAHEQLSMLQQLITMFQNEQVMESLLNVVEEEEFLLIMKQQILI